MPIEFLIGWPVIAGFIPYSFIRKTEKGKVVEIKIKALFFEYEKKKEGEKKVVIFNFRLINLIRHALLKLSEDMIAQLGEKE